MPEERLATARSTGSGIGNPNALYRAFGRSAGLLKRARESRCAQLLIVDFSRGKFVEGETIQRKC